MKRPNFKSFYKWSALALIGAILLGLFIGATSGFDSEIWLYIRLPRVIAAITVGIALVSAGMVYQATFSNPLCEPYTLGISSGAALGAVIAQTLQAKINFFGITGGALIGAILVGVVLLWISKSRKMGSLGLLLCGVMLGFLGSSLVAVWMALADGNGIQSALNWLLGDLSRATLEGSLFALGIVLFVTWLVWRRGKNLDLMMLGDLTAQARGLNVYRERQVLILLSSILVGVSVSVGGMIGFVGLVIPHLLRRTVGSVHYHLIPTTAIWASVAMIISDVGARTLFLPTELPVGVITAIIGAPVFVWVFALKGERGGAYGALS